MLSARMQAMLGCKKRQSSKLRAEEKLDSDCYVQWLLFSLMHDQAKFISIRGYSNRIRNKEDGFERVFSGVYI